MCLCQQMYKEFASNRQARESSYPIGSRDRENVTGGSWPMYKRELKSRFQRDISFGSSKL